MVEKVQLVSFRTSATYIRRYMINCRKLRDLVSLYARRGDGDMDFKNLRRLIAACEGLTLYSRITTARKDQRKPQTILSGERRAVML